MGFFEFALEIHKNAKNKDVKQSLIAYADWMPAKAIGISKYWSQIHLEVEKAELELEEFTFECLRNISVRNEASILSQISAIAAQGFEVIDLAYDEKNARLVVQDVSKLNPEIRRFHASQFVEELWFHTKSLVVIVDYLEKDGTPNLRTIASAELFEQAMTKSDPITFIASEVEMLDLKINKEISKADPGHNFKQVKLSSQKREIVSKSINHLQFDTCFLPSKAPFPSYHRYQICNFLIRMGDMAHLPL